MPPRPLHLRRVTEADFIAALRTLPLHPGARGLLDDAATLVGGKDAFILTTDTMVEHVHFAADLPAADVAWRLVACALSDLAAKGAEPVGVMLSVTLAGDARDAALVEGLRAVLAQYDCPLLGGDTVQHAGPDAPRLYGCTAIGRATHAPVPIRSGAKVSDRLYVTGIIGAALLGFEQPRTRPNAYRRPVARIADGIALAPHVSAMMDVSDGLLLDACRMAAASGLAVEISLDAVPVPAEFAEDRLRACTWGDDYQLLFALPPGAALPVPATWIGTLVAGSGLTLTEHRQPVPLPASLGYLHGG